MVKEDTYFEQLKPFVFFAVFHGKIRTNIC